MSHELAAKIQGVVLSSTSADFEAALKRNSALSVLSAKLVVQPAVYEDIPAILAYVASQNPRPEIVVKCQGFHSSTWSSTDGGVVIDLSKLNKVTLSDDKKIVTIQGGANWGDVYELGKKEGFEVPGTPFWFIGVGGSMLGGAYGNWTAAHGLGIDNLVGATVVLADGRIVKTSATEEPDLFWAIRGTFWMGSPYDDHRHLIKIFHRRRQQVWNHCRICPEDVSQPRPCYNRRAHLPSLSI